MTEILKQPPHSLEIEQTILSAVLNDTHAIDTVADMIAPDDFYRNDHRVIFQECVSLCQKNSPCDAVSVMGRLHDSGNLDNAGGKDYLIYIAVECNRGTANLKHYARELRKKTQERALLTASYKVGELVYDDLPTHEKIQNAQQMLMEIGEESDRTALVGVDRLIKDSLAEIDFRSSLGGGLIGLSTGFDKLDSMTGGLGKGEMVVIAGRPSMGKSTIAMNIVETNILAGKHCVVFNLEQPRNDVVMRTYSSLSGVHHDKIRKGHLNQEDWRRLNPVIEKLKACSLEIDDTCGLVTNQLRARLRRSSRKRPIDLIVVDYLQIMGDMTSDGKDHSRITLISRQLKSLAKEFHCPLIALSQLNRGVEQRGNKRPMMSDLRESGAIEQDADLILMMYRDEYYNEQSPAKGLAEVIIGKQRNGPIGTVFLSSQLEFMRFKDYTGAMPVYEKAKPFASLYGDREVA